MDLGIEGRKAIVCASSRGLGKGCAMALARAGISLVLNGWDKSVLEATGAEIAKNTGVIVTPVVGDISTTEGQAAVLAAWAKNAGISSKQVADQRTAQIPAERFGSAIEFGNTCAFLCSQHAGYITGQNILLDGGLYNSVM